MVVAMSQKRGDAVSHLLRVGRLDGREGHALRHMSRRTVTAISCPPVNRACVACVDSGSKINVWDLHTLQIALSSIYVVFRQLTVVTDQICTRVFAL